MVCLQGIEVARMDADKVAISPIDVRTLVPVLLGIMAVEVPLRTVAWHEAISPLVLLGVSRLIEATLIVGVVRIAEKGISAVGLSPGTALPGFRRGLVWSGGFGGIACLVSGFLLAMGVDPLPFINTPLPIGTGDVILFFLVGGIISPVAEELFFRGVVYGFLRRWGSITAIVLSTLVFVLAHRAFSGFPFNQVVGGIVFAIGYETEKNLMVPITLHVMGNLAIFAISLLGG